MTSNKKTCREKCLSCNDTEGRFRIPRFERVKIHLMLTVAIFCVCAAGRAAEKLTLEEALEIAGERNLRLRSSRQDRKTAAGRIVEARAGALPHLDLSAYYLRMDDVARFGVGPEAVQLGQLDNYEARAELNQILYAGGGVQAAIDMADSYGRSTDAGLERLTETIAYRVHSVFNLVLLARAETEVAEKAVAMAERNLSDVQSLKRQGMAKRFEELRAEAEVSRAESDLIAARNNLHKARLKLCRILEIPFSPAPRIDGALDIEASKTTDENLLETALRNRSDYAAARHAVDMRRNAAEVSRSGRRPNLIAFGNVKRSNPNRSFEDEWENSWEVGVRMNWALFDGFATRGKLLQSASKLEKAKIELDDLSSQIELEVANSRADLQTAAALTKSRALNVEQSQESLRLVRQAYREGMQAQIDVITAQLELSESRRRHQAALYQHIMAQRRLELAMGTLAVGEGRE